MKLMKNIMLPMLLLGLLTTISCNKDDGGSGGGGGGGGDLCENKDCGTFGGCSEGYCMCQDGYGYDSDMKCNHANRDKYLGTFTGSDGCTTVTGVTVSEGNDGISSIKITYHFPDSTNNSIVITGYAREGATSLLYGGTATIDGVQVTYNGTSISVNEDIDEVYVEFDAVINGTQRKCIFTGTR